MNSITNLFYTNTPAFCFGVMLFFALLLEVSTLTKRRMRICELRHKIDLIRDPNGNSFALQNTYNRYGYTTRLSLYRQCVHLSRVYYIPLSRVGIIGGRDGLMKEAFESQKRADERGDIVLKGQPLPRSKPGWWHRSNATVQIKI